MSTDLNALMRSSDPAQRVTGYDDTRSQCLVERIVAESAADEPSTRPIGARRKAGAVVAVAAGAALAAVALTVNTLSAPAAIALVPVAPESFPMSVRVLPPGLGASPVFERDANFQLARWSGSGGSVTLVQADPSYWQVPGDAAPIEVAGQAGNVFSVPDNSGTALTIVWQQADEDWVGVTGRGDYADLSVLKQVAAGVADAPQPVHLVLTVAPDGWSAVRYKDDRVVTYAESAAPDARTLDVMVRDALSTDLAGDYGATDVTKASARDGRTFSAGRVGEDWVVEGRTTSGKAFAVLTPGGFTSQQAVTVAAGVEWTG